ncbi:hypothetical protein [Butyrivibrio sp. WCD3002]|uniref:hypothetical protein n=1 Tax=Butyrivibrio sp. WCD3002 TaxID=1280676 RepID=UPI000414FA02|nr:hypothetical protein [Butyrivibrio sp. WCD3002]
MSSFFENIDADEIRSSAEKIIEITGDGAKRAYTKAKDGYNGLSDDTKKAITLGVTVFAIVIAVAGIFYLLGKRSGKKEKYEFEYEEWDG